MPFRAILHWWLGSRGILQVHGGAVGLSEAGVLLVGRGGSGKSTTALACLAAGLRYAGDDFVAVSTRPEPHVHSLYGSGKVEPNHLQRFPELVKAVSNPEPGPREKSIVFVEHVHPGAAIAGFPLHAVVVPRVVARSPETRLVPTSGAAALAALAPSTVFLLYPSTPQTFAELAALVRSVPMLLARARLGNRTHPGRDRRAPANRAVKNPLVSVVTPVYNGEAFLRETLDSIFALDYEPFEVIVVDDGSTDGSGAIARSYPGLRYIRQENLGPAAARNTGIEAARGEFLAFVDADDVVLPQKLTVQVGYLLTHPETSVTLAQQDWIDPPPRQGRGLAWGDATGVQPTSIVLRKSIMVAIGCFDPTTTPTDDFDVLIRLREHGHDLVVVPEIVMRRRYHGANLVLGRGVDKSLPARLLKAKLDRERSRPTA